MIVFFFFFFFRFGFIYRNGVLIVFFLNVTLGDLFSLQPFSKG